jgi:apolipoprotein N-acyltransferase
MVSNAELRTPWYTGVLATALTAVFWWFASRLSPCTWLAWLAPVPLLWLAPRVRARWACASAFIAWFVGGMNIWAFAHDELEMPWLVLVIMSALPALVFAACVLLVRAHWRRGRLWLGALSLPAAWVAVEFLSARASPHGTFGNLAYTQIEALPLLQLVALAGPWALSFLALFIAAAIGALCVPQVALARRMMVLGAAVAALAASWTFGASRLQYTPPASQIVRVAVLAADQPDVPLPWDDARAQAVVTAYIAEIGRLADAGAQAAVLPETIVKATTAQWPVLSQPFAELARARGITIAVGIDLIEAEQERNVSAVFQAGHAEPLMYAKRHLVPMFEDRYTPGTASTVFAVPDGAWGTAVCKDLDFLALGREYGAAGIGLLLVPAWDFGQDGWLHARMAMMRGVENGYAVARTARRGLLTISDNRGRVLAEVSSATAPMTSVIAELPVVGERTLYGRIGDALAWACALLALTSVVVAGWRRDVEP